MNCMNPNPNRPRRCGFFSPIGALCFLALVLLLTIGLAVGAFYSAQITPVLPAIIAFGAAILVIIVALLIYYWRIRNN